ncbi:MAG: cohesin domain-containing protein [bacterium]|nr:cohesin domain-containing protein [bacterium]
MKNYHQDLPKGDNLKFKITKSVLVNILILVFFGGLRAEAAQIYFEPPPATYKVGEGFTLVLILDAEGQSINAVDISIQVPKLLKIKNISKSGSVIQLWVNEPSFSGDSINLIGGVPGGTTTPKGVIAKINFEAAAIGEGNIAFKPGSSVLLNDGQGTQLDLKTAGGPVFRVIPKPKETITISPESKPKKTPAEVEEKAEEIKDNKKPEKFEILIGEDPRVFEGQHFISFFSTDNDSGIDHYEVKEGKGEYKIAQSPFLLSDQELKTVLKVRAYDGAENYRESVFPNLFIRTWWWFLNLFSG